MSYVYSQMSWSADQTISSDETSRQGIHRGNPSADHFRFLGDVRDEIGAE